MGFYFHKRFKIGPRTYLNLSKKGASVSTGVPGLSISSRGNVNASVPGTGLRWRGKIGSLRLPRAGTWFVLLLLFTFMKCFGVF